MRGRIVFAAALATGLVAAGGTAALAAPGPQSHIKLSGAPINVGPAGCPGLSLAVQVVITGNGHDHIVGTTDANGNPLPGYHENATVTGSLQLVDFTDPSNPVVLGTGHGQAWFTIDVNTGGTVTSEDNVSAHIDTGLAAGLKIIGTGSFTLNANGVPVVNNSKLTCS